jgi:polyphosphate glucokinase
MSIVFGVDVGGSGVKAAPVDTASGDLVHSRNRIPTPQPATPEAVYDVIEELLDTDDWQGPFGVAIPAVVTGGVARTAANIDDSWIGRDVRSDLASRRTTDVIVLNDADAAGVAEMRFGQGRGVGGVVIVLTFGTGVGSAVFVDGRLVPNTEFGHLEFLGGAAELSTAARLVEDDDMAVEEWAQRVDRYLDMLYRVFTPSLVIFGGGISKRFEAFGHLLHIPCEVVPAALRNEAGIVGAALAAEHLLEAT